MNKFTLSFLLLLCCSFWGWSNNFPIVSKDGETTWYFIRFLNGGNVVKGNADNSKVTTASISFKNNEAMLWKIEGEASTGYTLTNQKGQKLYVDNAQKQGMFYASSTATNNTLMQLSPSSHSAYAKGFELQPFGKTDIAMNQWGGAGAGKELGLWTKGDGNNPLTFVPAPSAATYANTLPLIPYPKKVTKKEGDLSLNTLTTIHYGLDSLQNLLSDFKQQLQQTAGINLSLTATPSIANNSLSFVVDATLPADAYHLSITANNIVVKASNYGGFFYGLQTIKQLLPMAFWGKKLNQATPWTLPQLEIQDEPMFSHRGVMIDEARHFFGKEAIKKILNTAALYKINRLHWHLTDDQGWRIHIPEYPKLTEVGSVRKGSFSNFGEGHQFFDDTEYGRGMFYTLDELKEIVKYAKERNIEIIPEVDLPGHMVAAVSAYPIFSCDPSKTYEVRIPGGISKDVLNIGKDTVISFLKCVLGHVAQTFPYPVIHLGGDECPTDQWANNKEALARVREKQLNGVNELQSWLVEELGTFLDQEYGKEILVWDELLAHWSEKNKIKPIIMAWNNINFTKRAADRGFKSIVCPYQTLYLDMLQMPVSELNIDEPYHGGWGDNWVNSVPKAYDFNPIGSLPAEKASYCLGVQGNMWTETTNNAMELEYQLFPRLLAIAETGWKPAQDKDFADFYIRLQKQASILDSLGVTFAKHYIEEPKRTEAEEIEKEAQWLLSQSIPGGVGYPQEKTYNALQKALLDFQKDTTKLSELKQQIVSFKQDSLVMPQEGKFYQIVSASTYFKRKYAGSTLYQKEGIARFHYTQQNEPEELWLFEKTTTKTPSYYIKNKLTGQYLNFAAYNQTCKMGNVGTNASFRITNDLQEVKGYTYIPGVVMLSSHTDLVTSGTQNIRRLYANYSGEAISFNDKKLCYPNAWRIVEVSDFTLLLKALVDKCERISTTNVANTWNSYKEENIQFLRDSLITPAKPIAQAGNVSQKTYLNYEAIYKRFTEMPRVSLLESLDPNYFYRIRNAHFKEKFAAATENNGTLVPSNGEGDKALWYIKKLDNHKIELINKHTRTAAYPASVRADQALQTGKPYAWSLQPIKTDQGSTGIAIVDAGSTFSWYTNPSSFPNIIFKPKDWGASIWIFEKVEQLTTNVKKVSHQPTTPTHYYSLEGKEVSKDAKGVVITNDGRKHLK